LGFEQVRQRGSHIVLKNRRQKVLLDAWCLCTASWLLARCGEF
jgi:hypothetical protein